VIIVYIIRIVNAISGEKSMPRCRRRPNTILDGDVAEQGFRLWDVGTEEAYRVGRALGRRARSSPGQPSSPYHKFPPSSCTLGSAHPPQPRDLHLPPTRQTLKAVSSTGSQGGIRHLCRSRCVRPCLCHAGSGCTHQCLESGLLGTRRGSSKQPTQAPGFDGERL